MGNEDAAGNGWQDIHSRLTHAIGLLKQNKVADIVVTEALKQIPIVGGWLSALWGKVDGPRKKPEELVAILEILAADSAKFDALVESINANHTTLEELLLSAHRRLVDILDKFTDKEAKLDVMSAQLEKITKGMAAPSVARALRLVAALDDDKELRADLMAKVDALITQSGLEPSGATYESVGYLVLRQGNKELAEAAFLRAIEMDPAAGLVGLSIVYQRRATNFLVGENFGLAEKAIGRARQYALEASMHNLAEPLVLCQLGMAMKDMAQRFQDTGQAGKAAPLLEDAEKQFKMALAVDPKDANGYDGLGSVAMLRGDYAGALVHLRRAVELEPRHVFAHMNIAQLEIALYEHAPDEQEKLSTLLRGFQSFTTAKELLEARVDTLPPDLVADLEERYKSLIERHTAS